MGINLTGPALRAAVAEHVMGYKRYARPQNPGLYILMQEPWPNMILAPEGAQPYNDYLREVPPFEEEMGAAWQVVEKMNSRMNSQTVRGYEEGRAFQKRLGALVIYSAPEATHLICEAALEAVGYKEG